jgi:hypothetical protein
MQETNDSRYAKCNVICDAVRYINDATYAILPKDVAHNLGELEKNFWGGVRWLVDKQLKWIEERLDSSDRLREEWERERARPEASGGGGI